MLKKLKKLSLIALTLVTLLNVFTLNVNAAGVGGVQDWESQAGLNCTGAGSGITAADASDVATIQGFACLISNVFSVAITVIGMVALVMFIIASFKYLTSGGNSKSTDQAKSTLTYVIIGLVVSVSAFIILNLISNFTGVDVTQFIIPGADS